ncbi:MAG: Mu transposase C-terminal domain-containing protein [Chloroflexi bacterium]|nr:Mu transposase C-terminal domain-containing protein [Chloroflexota bacterium]
MPDSLDQLDLLLLTVARPRRVHQHGIHFHGFRYLDTTLAAYVGEDVIIRYDPRDMAEVRVFFADQSLCRAINPELTGETIAVKDIIWARNQHRRQLHATLADREATIETLLALRRGQELGCIRADAPGLRRADKAAVSARPRLKRYFNDE